MSDELIWQTTRPDHFRALAYSGVYFVYVDTNWTAHHLIACYDTSLEPSMERPSKILYRSLSRDFDEAKRAAQTHHDAACRARRWADYMRDNEPPLWNVPPGPCGEHLTGFGGIGDYFCELLAGHAGHHVDGGCSWTVRSIEESRKTPRECQETAGGTPETPTEEAS